MQGTLIKNKITINASLENITDVISNLDNIISANTNDNTIILLDGDLSSGKTTLVQKYTSMYCDDKVTSPTFSIIHEYGANIFHYDLYQKKWNELLAIGIVEFLAQSGTHFIEWPSSDLRDTLLSFNINPINIFISNDNDNTREYKITYE